jgi:hypothetical protein
MVVTDVGVPVVVVVGALYGKQVFDPVAKHRLVLRVPEGRLSVALVVSIGPCGRVKL